MNAPETAHPVRYHVLMLSFPGVDAARGAYGEIKDSGILDACEIEAEAVVSRSNSGEIHAGESGGAGIGAAFGATGAGLVGLLTGPIILPLMIVAGGVLGGVAGHFAGQVLPPDDLRRVAEGLPPGSSAYVAVVEANHAAAVAEAYRSKGAAVIDIPVETEVASAIREGLFHDVTHG